MHPESMLSGVLIQKYIEHPLIVHGRKFDIRQWIMVTSIFPLEAWIYDGCYIRFSGENFDLDNLSDFIHLTNHSVQATKLNKVGKSFDKSKSVDFSKMTTTELTNTLKSREMMSTRSRRNLVMAQLEPHEFVSTNNIWSLDIFKVSYCHYQLIELHLDLVN